MPPVWRVLALALVLFLQQPAWAAEPDFRGEPASADARQVAHWAVQAGDHGSMPFVIVDKRDSKVFVFDAGGRLLGAAPALIGSARGDESAPDIGQRKLSAILPNERTTPAGRFVAALSRSVQGDEILWVDYDTSIALHRVIATAPVERRLQRLASLDPSQRRITYGCINVSVRFYESVVIPAFRQTSGIVYVLPETRPLQQVFDMRESTEVVGGGHKGAVIRLSNAVSGID